MKLTAQALRKIIREEVQKAVLTETADPQLLQAISALVAKYGSDAVFAAFELAKSASEEMKSKSTKNAMMMDPERMTAWRAFMGM